MRPVGHRYRRSRGALLVEAIVATYLLCVLSLVFAVTITAAFRSRMTTDDRTKAVCIAAREIDRIENLGYGGLTYPALLYYGVIDASPTESPYGFTNVGGEPERVSSLLRSGTGTIEISDISSSIRRVTVTVSWLSRYGRRSVSVSTMLCDLR